MRTGKTTVVNAVNYVIIVQITHHALLASAINRYQRNDFFQIADVRLDFMIITPILLIVKVNNFKNFLNSSFIYNF